MTFISLYCQEKCSAIIDWKYLETIDIYDHPNGTIIHQMKNDSINEDFLHLDIFDFTDTHFNVSIRMTIKKDSATGWIKKADYIGAFKRHEKFPMDLTLYTDKKVLESNKFIVKNWTPGLLTIENYEGDWIFISLTQNGKIYKGWIQENELCANAYSTCS